MSKNKPVIILIVEGESDKEAFDGILNELYTTNELYFHITRGDITTQPGTSEQVIKSKIGDIIKMVISKTKAKASDIRKIVHIVDMDGAYIDDDIIFYDKINDPLYKENGIYTKDVEYIIKRNENKRKIINKLSTMSSIKKDRISIEYSLYYMSCNLDHVLHNIINLDTNKKVTLSEDFSDKYIDYPAKFLEFISNSDFTVKNNYRESWEFIKKDNNSIKRFSNFHLFFTS